MLEFFKRLLKQDEDYLALAKRRVEETPTAAFKEHYAYMVGRVQVYREIVAYLTKQEG